MSSSEGATEVLLKMKRQLDLRWLARCIEAARDDALGFQIVQFVHADGTVGSPKISVDGRPDKHTQQHF